MPKAPTLDENAGTEYDRRHPERDWQTDSLLAVVVVITVEVLDRLVRLYENVPAEPMTPWACEMLDERWADVVCFRMGMAMKPVLPLPSDATLEWLRCESRLCHVKGRRRHLPPLPPRHRLHGLPSLNGLLVRMEGQRRVHHHQLVFATSVRDWLRLLEAPEPTTTDIALLASATRFELFDDDLEIGRRRWAARLRKWEKRFGTLSFLR